MSYKDIKVLLNNGIQTIYIKTETSIKKISIKTDDNSEQDVEKRIGSLFDNVIRDKFFNFEKDPLECDSLDISKDSYYYRELNNDFNPFKELETATENADGATEEDFKNIKGYYFLYYKNHRKAFAYQKKKEKATLKKGMLFKFTDNLLEVMDNDIFVIEPEIDFIVYKNNVFYYNPKVIDNEFGAIEYTRKTSKNKLIDLSKKYSELSGHEDLVNNLQDMYLKKIKNFDKYKIVDMNKNDLINIVKNDKELSSKITIKDNNFKIDTITDLKRFINLMSDDYLRSSITNKMYISDSKRIE